ncbi:hypothetical protein [Aquabacterium sp.]|uniref:hypothetical protein n=1 Tax=Aquabacterium sp. TaxID=1872578 RepID=UPI004037B0A1
MQRAIFIGFLILGVIAGLLSAWYDRWGMKLAMIAIGALVGSAIGGGLANLVQRKKVLTDVDDFTGDRTLHNPLGTSSDDLSANYWRDKGLPPFVRGQDAGPDKHMFDPDKIGS